MSEAMRMKLKDAESVLPCSPQRNNNANWKNKTPAFLKELMSA